jgi:hypothetical protein
MVGLNYWRVGMVVLKGANGEIENGGLRMVGLTYWISFVVAVGPLEVAYSGSKR